MSASGGGILVSPTQGRLQPTPMLRTCAAYCYLGSTVTPSVSLDLEARLHVALAGSALTTFPQTILSAL